MHTITPSPRGSILIVVLIAVIIIASISAAVMGTAMANARSLRLEIQSETSLQRAEEGIARALADRVRGQSGNLGTAAWSADTDDLGEDGTTSTGDIGEGDGRPTLGEPNVSPVVGAEGSFFTWCELPSSGWVLIHSTAVYQDAGRTLIATVRETSGLPVPGAGGGGDPAAFGIVGSLDKAKIKLKDKLNNAADDADGPGLQFNGIDKSGKKSKVFGMGIEDDETFNEFAERYDRDVVKGKLSDLTLEGKDATVDYSTKKGDGSFTGSLKDQDNGNLGVDFLRTLGDRIEAGVEENLIPNADTTITGKDAKIDTDQTWGTPSDPEITVIDADTLKVDKGATISGAGVLIVKGRLDLHDATFNFAGAVIVLGADKKDARIHNHHGTTTIDGPLVVIANEKGKASVHIHNEAGTAGNQSGTTVNGAMLLLATESGKAKKNEARFHYHHGTMRVNGFFGMFGDDRAKMHIHGKKDGDKQGSFEMNGATVIGSLVDPSEPKDKGRVDVHLHGGNIKFNYDSVELAKGLASIAKLLETTNPDEDVLPPASRRVVGWQDARRWMVR